MHTREQAKAIIDRVLSLSKADEISIRLSGGTTSHLRFARNATSTSGSYQGPSLNIASSFGKRTGSVKVNQFDTDSLKRALRRSEELASLAPEDPEHMPALNRQNYPAVAGFSQKTADHGAEKLADWVNTCIGQAESAGVKAAGYSQTTARYSCVANSRGLFGYHQSSGAYLSETARTDDDTGSGWAATASHRIEDIDAPLISRTAVNKAKLSAKARPIEPGKYVTILEPACVANLIAMAVWFMGKRAADEGRSYFSAAAGGNRIGEKLFDERIHIYSDPADPNVPGSPWGSDGVPQTRRDWIKGGVLENLHVDRYWAKKTGVEPIPQPANLIWKGRRGSVDDLVASTERGILVTSLWYIRPVDRRTLLFTGITRDGVFWIENGKIAHPVQNLRWNESPINVLGNLDAMSASQRVAPRNWRTATAMLPAIRVKEFQFTSRSEAV